MIFSLFSNIIFYEKSIVDFKILINFILFVKFKKLSKTSCKANKEKNKADFALFIIIKIFLGCSLKCKLLFSFFILLNKGFNKKVIGQVR